MNRGRCQTNHTRAISEPQTGQEAQVHAAGANAIAGRVTCVAAKGCPDTEAIRSRIPDEALQFIFVPPSTIENRGTSWPSSIAERCRIRF